MRLELVTVLRVCHTQEKKGYGIECRRGDREEREREELRDREKKKDGGI